MGEASRNALARIGESLWGEQHWPDELRIALGADANEFGNWQKGRCPPPPQTLDHIKVLIREREQDLCAAKEILENWQELIAEGNS